MVKAMSIEELRDAIGYKELKIDGKPANLLYLVLKHDGDVWLSGVQRNRFLCVRKGEDAELMRLIYEIVEHGGGWKPIRVEDEDDLIVVDAAQMIQHRREALKAINMRKAKTASLMQKKLEEYTLMGEIKGLGEW